MHIPPVPFLCSCNQPCTTCNQRMNQPVLVFKTLVYLIELFSFHLFCCTSPPFMSVYVSMYKLDSFCSLFVLLHFRFFNIIFLCVLFVRCLMTLNSNLILSHRTLYVFVVPTAIVFGNHGFAKVVVLYACVYVFFTVLSLPTLLS